LSARGGAWHARGVAVDPTARALRAVHVLAADLAAERRENAALRRTVAELEAEIDRLERARTQPRTANPPPRPRPASLT
jgi:hypothetical protein